MAPLVRTGGSRHTGLAALPHCNIQIYICWKTIGKLKHEDIGQMQMYVNYYDRKVKMEDENPTIGIIICKDKKDAVIEMTLPENNSQIFASKYQTVLPSKAELQKLLEDRNLE